MGETQACACGLCGQDVDPDKEPFIQSTCNLDNCGSSIWHLECIQEYLESGQGDKKVCSSTRKALMNKVYIKNRPWDHLKGRNCPVGRGKNAEANGIEPCAGRVNEAEHYEPVGRKKKKQLKDNEHLLPKALMKASKGHPPPKAAPPAKAAKPPHAAPPAKVAQKAIHSFEYYHQYNRPRKRHEQEGDGESIHSSTSKASEYVFADNVVWISEEEIEAAIVQGFLRQDYRTNLCQTVADGTPCHLANRCQHAHALSELRLNAAIALEKIPPDFKTSLCDDFLITGDCPEGIACHRAHSLEELRTLAAIQQKLLPSNFKTERCSAYDTSQSCPRGEMCSFAHGSKQLRVEAAIQAGKLPMEFKCLLCPMWWAGETCPNGDHCSKAHGLQELRIQAAINQKIIKDLYKTQRCTNLHCKGPLGQFSCWFFHTDQDKLKPVGYRSQFCKTWKETGTCAYGEECHFAHDAKELIIETVASKFVEKSVEEDDSVSQFSIDDSVDMHAKREVGIVPYSVLNGKMPVAIPQGKQRRKAAKGVALQLCAAFERTGQCPDPNCRFAHGIEELKERQLKAKGGQVGNATGAKAFNPALVPAPRKLSPAVLEAMRSHKLQAAVAILMGMGFGFAASERAARTTGANTDMAAQLLLDGGSGFHEHGVTEISVKEEVDALCAMADSLDLATKNVEAEVLRCHGDHLKAMQDLQKIKLIGSRRVPPKVPPTIHEDDHGHEYLNQGWKNMAQPSWGPTEAAGSSAPVTASYLYNPAPLPHNAPASIGLPHHATQATTEHAGAAAETEEWQQYRPEDFGPDPLSAPGSHPEADLQAALQASLADAPPLGPATGFKFAEASQQVNNARPVTQQSQANRPPPPSPFFSQQISTQPVASMGPVTLRQPIPIPKPLPTPHANGTASRNWFPAESDTTAFQSTGAAAAGVTESLASLHIAPLQSGSADSCDGALASGEVTPQPSITYDLSPQSVIPPGNATPTSVNELLPWLTAAADSKGDAKAQAPAPSNPAPAAADGGSTEDFDNLMAMLMS